MSPASPPDSSAPALLCVLLVEDDASLRYTLAVYLRAEGYRVLEADSVQDARALLLAGAPVDVVFTDLHLVGEATGRSLSSWLAREFPQLPLLLTSGDHDAGLERSASPGRDFIPKPYDLQIVDARLRSMIH